MTFWSYKLGYNCGKCLARILKGQWPWEYLFCIMPKGLKFINKPRLPIFIKISMKHYIILGIGNWRGDLSTYSREKIRAYLTDVSYPKLDPEVSKTLD